MAYTKSPPGFFTRILSSTKGRVLNEIKKKPTHGYELANRLGISLSSAYEHLGDLRQSGFVDFKEEGRRRVYFLTDKGKYLLKALR